MGATSAPSFVASSEAGRRNCSLRLWTRWVALANEEFRAILGESMS
jgi:hypothetical protein